MNYYITVINRDIFVQTALTINFKADTNRDLILSYLKDFIVFDIPKIDYINLRVKNNSTFNLLDFIYFFQFNWRIDYDHSKGNRTDKSSETYNRNLKSFLINLDHFSQLPVIRV